MVKRECIDAKGEGTWVIPMNEKIHGLLNEKGNVSLLLKRWPIDLPVYVVALFMGLRFVPFWEFLGCESEKHSALYRFMIC